MKEIISQFFDYAGFVRCQPFGSGHINDTFRLEVQSEGLSRPWLLQRLNHQVFQQPDVVMENIRLVSEYLSAQPTYPLQVLCPVPALDGRLLHRDAAGNYWRVFPFFENTISFDRVETPEQSFEAARAFGCFARALNGMDASRLRPTIPGFHDGLRRLAYFMEVLERALPDRLSNAGEEVASILAESSMFEEVDRLPLPLRVIHHDTKINNVLFDASTRKAVCVIDLDTVMPGIILSDFGDMMRTFTNAAGEDEADASKVFMRVDVYEALSEGFLSEMSDLLTPAEREHLPGGGLWLTLMQAVRFLADYLEGDVYYKTAYAGHNLVRTRNQLALFRSMKKGIKRQGI
jgi:Ser/Thr protein kinase RdoA (MazF antagonist)